MIPRFSLARPANLLDAFAAHADANGDGAYYAGGTELLQVMKMGLAQFRWLIDLKAVDELRGIAVEPDGRLRIGATTTHREIERSRLVGERLPALARLERDVANVRVRNTGTLGGNLAFAEPHSDPATFLLACDAELELAAPTARRRIGIGDFVLGPLFTAREADEILVAVRVPAAVAGEGRGYAKIKFFERPAASVAVRLRVANGRLADATVTVGSLTDVPVAVPAAADRLVGAPVEGDAMTPDLASAIQDAAEAFGEIDAESDLNGSADYKRHLAGVLLRRAVADALLETPAHA
jgi:carbon-monoxide dehydrogenase medium subunit